jgi:hypothetical protein
MFQQFRQNATRRMRGTERKNKKTKVHHTLVLYMHPKSSSNPRPSRPPFWQKLHNAWIREMLQIGQKWTKIACLQIAEEVQERPAQIDSENASDECRLSLPRARNLGLSADE